MQSFASKLILLLFVVFVLASCATAPSQAPQPVRAGYLYIGGYINVRVPNSDGWHLMRSSPSGMEFARSGAERGESFGAQVLLFPLPETKTEEEFVALMQRSFEADTDSARFSVVKSEFEYSGERSYPCVRVVSVVEDKKAKTSPIHSEKLLLQSNSLYCRHPVRQATGFAIIYSHRGKTQYGNLSAEATDFIAGVQVPEQ